MGASAKDTIQERVDSAVGQLPASLDDFPDGGPVRTVWLVLSGVVHHDWWGYGDYAKPA